mmetsp:Transcript_24392/g.23445  ORF Transcript_24392/g.23445 Transcript_24392/m.23445 type:complete len:132 (-) Transcript_24392:243-638(-)
MTSTHVNGVLDLTFLDIKEEIDLQNALSSDRTHNMATTQTLTSSSGKKSKEVIKAIRIANNQISNLSILINPFQQLFDTSKIMWLDISFNCIENINPIIFDLFPNVTALYLQSNKITKLSEIRKLENFRFF